MNNDKSREELEHLLRFWSEEAREKEINKRLSNNSLLDQIKQVEDNVIADDSLAMIAEKAELEKAEKKVAKAAKAKATRAANKAKKETAKNVENILAKVGSEEGAK